MYLSKIFSITRVLLPVAALYNMAILTWCQIPDCPLCFHSPLWLLIISTVPSWNTKALPL